MPAMTGVLETALYVDDVERAVEFYTRVMGFETLFVSERAAGLNVADKQVFLLFLKGGTQQPIVSRRGTIPPHDGDGSLHVAFAVPEEALEEWEETLAANGVDIVARYDWERGGRSVYFHDPDGHVIELVTPGCWTVY